MKKNKEGYYKAVFHTIVTMKKLADNAYANVLETSQLSFLQFQALSYIQQNSRPASHQIAEFLSVSPSSLAQLIERLEGYKLITRMPDEKDKRVTRVQLTTFGEEKMQGLTQMLYKKAAEILNCFSADEEKEFLRLQQKLLINLQHHV